MDENYNNSNNSNTDNTNVLYQEILIVMEYQSRGQIVAHLITDTQIPSLFHIVNIID
jgi:hypothetical protein